MSPLPLKCLEITSVWGSEEDVVKMNLYPLIVGLLCGSVFMENSMETSQKLRLVLPYDQAISLLHIYPSTKILIQKGILSIFIAALF